jgi:carboxyl-terminal processing protease
MSNIREIPAVRKNRNTGPGLFLVVFLFLPLSGKPSAQPAGIYKIMQLFTWIDRYYVDTVDTDSLSGEIIRKTLSELDPHSVYVSKEGVRATTEPLSGSLSARSTGIYKITQLFEWIDRYYVDTVDTDSLSEEIIRKTLSELDPHSVYVSKEGVRAMTEPLAGSFEGIGVSFNIFNDTILIISPISGGPSERTGIRSGDRIITVNGDTVAGKKMNNADLMKRLRGKKGTEVNVGILRRGNKELLDFRIIRDKIPIHSIDAAYKVSDNIGYIRLSRFAASSKNEFDEALSRLRKEGMTDLILDLTGNGGGYIDVAVQLADEFFNRGIPIVYTEGVHNHRRDYLTTSGGNFKKGRLVVMINESSASASEILAGAVQDWDRGIIVGRRSFGKGLVQRQIFFLDSSMLRLTTSRYYTPTGRTIQKPYHKNNEYSKEVESRLQTGELTGGISVDFPDSLKYQTLIKKRTVYGGGGIMPDVFVPMDTSFSNTYYRELLGKGIFYRFVLNYVDKNRQHLESKYPAFEEFDEKFKVTESILNDLQDFAEKEGLTKNPELFAKSHSYLAVWIKAYIARDLWDSTELYRITNRQNPIFIQAVAEMKRGFFD